jgi:hypothetical protein
MKSLKCACELCEWPSEEASFDRNAVANGVKGRYSPALSEFGPQFLNMMQRSVNRKVQGSNPCSGASSKIEIEAQVGGVA